ncbi:MAG: hypothetical protein Q8P13_04865 [bacterium]|nr:hypothetical protein [bacterium]
MENDENHTNEVGGGVVGLIILYLIGAFFFHWWPFGISYDKPWWDGTEYQRVCVVHNPNNDNCYTLAVTVEDKRIVEMEFPNGGYVSISSQECGKAVTFEGRYCVIYDTKGGDWQVEKSN